MKELNKYEELEISVIEFENADVITNSKCDELPPLSAG